MEEEKRVQEEESPLDCDIKSAEKVFQQLLKSVKTIGENSEAVKKSVETEPVTQESLAKQALIFEQEATRRSEELYNGLVKNIVELSGSNLIELREDKRSLRIFFEEFFVRIISAQFLVLILLLFMKAANPDFNISDKVLISFMSSVFVQTLGGIIIMITFAFKSNEEVKIISILNTFIRTYQKYKTK